VQVCQFHALTRVGKTILVFPQLCHGCGSCTWNCPEDAIKEVPNPIGLLESGNTPEGIHFLQGVLTISEPMPTPIIRQLKRWQEPPIEAVLLLDAPPGASCSVVETLRGCDFVLLVTESTPFGMHDLKQMTGIVQDMDIPAGIIINRENDAYPPLIEFSVNNNLPILMHVPYDRIIAEGLAAGNNLVEIYPEYVNILRLVFEHIQRIRNAKNNTHKAYEVTS